MLLTSDKKTNTEGDIPSDTEWAKGGFEPPPYTPPSPAEDVSPRFNHIYIQQRNHAISGEWTIDPNVRVPESLLHNLPKGAERENLFLESHDYSVSIRLKLISDGPEPTRSTLRAASHDGTVTVKILSRANQRFRLSAESKDGHVSVWIPRDFEGPVTFTNVDGTTRFSDAVSKRLAHFSTSGKGGKAFIGSWSTSGFEATAGVEGRWMGDELVLGSNDGNVTVSYTDEDTVLSSRAQTGGGGGVFSFLKRQFGGATPANDALAPEGSNT